LPPLPWASESEENAKKPVATNATAHNCSFHDPLQRVRRWLLFSSTLRFNREGFDGCIKSRFFVRERIGKLKRRNLFFFAERHNAGNLALK